MAARSGRRSRRHTAKALSLLDRLTVREQLWIKAVVEDWRGNREQGIENYKTYVSQHADDDDAWFRLDDIPASPAALLLASEAAALGANIIVITNNRLNQASYLYLKGEIEVAEAQYDEAIASFERGLKTEGFPAESVVRAYRLSGKLDQAIGCYEEYLKLNLVDRESWVLARYELAKICELKGMRDRAVESYDQFVNMWKEGDQNLRPLVDAKRRLAKLNAASTLTSR